MNAAAPPSVAFSRPEIGEDEIAEVVACLRSGWITTGPRVAALEAAWREATGTAHAAAVSSCTAALHVTLLALGVGPGDEVILPPLTWPATANMVVAAGARPVFADIDPVTWNIAPRTVVRALTPRTRAVIAVHYAGQPVDLDELTLALDAAGRTDVRIIEDAAHAAGTVYKGRKIGDCRANGTAAACFSFHPIKNMTTAEGGLIATDDAELARRIRLHAFHGVERDAWKAYAGLGRPATTYDVVLPGFKYNLTDLHAALGIHQLRKLRTMNARRAELAGRYERGLRGVRGLVLPGRAAYAFEHSHHLYAVLAPRGARPAFMEGLKALGIGTGLHFEAVHLSTYYRERFGGREGQCPVAEDVCSRVVSLPLWPGMSDADADRVMAAIERQECMR